jgi:hypothetical protein
MNGRVTAVHAAVLYVCAIVCPIYPLSADVSRSDASGERSCTPFDRHPKCGKAALDFIGEAKDAPEAQRSLTNRFPTDCGFVAEDFRRMHDPASQSYTVARIRKEIRPDREKLAFGNDQLRLSSALPSVPFAIGDHSDSRCSLIPF